MVAAHHAAQQTRHIHKRQWLIEKKQTKTLIYTLTGKYTEQDS